MALDLTREQKNTGAANFAQAAADLARQANPNDPTRRTFLKAVAATGAVLPVSAAVYFGYDQWKGLGYQPVRTAIIGTGDEGGILIGEHNPEFTQIVAACDIRPYNQERIFTGDADGDAKKWNGKSPRKGLNHIYGAKAADIRKFDSFEDLLKAKDELKLEAVIIATPLVTHHDLAIKCMDAGLHVLCEKLMARRIEYCKRMIAAAKKNGVILSIGHQRHYSMLYAHALEVVNAGVLGDVKHIRALWHRNNTWPFTPKSGGPATVPGTDPQLRDGWYPPIYQMDAEKVTADVLKGITFKGPDGNPQQCFDDLEHLVRWRLFDKPGGGLMAELGSHQLDACSIFLGKVKPLSVTGVGGRFFYGDYRAKAKGLPTGPNPRESDDSVFVSFEFPGAKHPAAGKGGTDDHDVVVVTYSSVNTNSFESYGECLMGSRGSLVVESEGDAYLFKENQPGKANSGGKGTNVTVTSKDGKAPVMEAASTWGGPGNAAVVKTGNGSGWGAVSRGYREEMEHFAYCVRAQQKAKLPGDELYKKKDGKFVHADVLPRCHGEIAMADAVLALTANLAMDTKTRIEFKPEWFNPDVTGKGSNPEDVHEKKPA